MEEYLLSVHEMDVLLIVRAASLRDIPFKMLAIDLSKLNEQNSALFKKLIYRINVWDEKPKWSQALNRVQELFINKEDSAKRYYNLKENFPVSFVNLPSIAGGFPTHQSYYQFVTVKGTVIRTKERGLREVVREYKCRKCKCTTLIHADRLTEFHFDVPSKCNKSECKGALYPVKDPSGEENLNFYIDFQEIKVQRYDEPLSLLAVELANELVESCFIGDIVTICGTIETRSPHNSDSTQLVLRAASVLVHQNQQKFDMEPYEMIFEVQDKWRCDLEQYDGDELVLRDQMIASVAPELDGLSIVKLGLMLVLCSGGSSKSEGAATQAYTASTTTREISHFLIIGDPGMGKSQLLKAASQISTNAVRSVGYAATTAGLTAHCFKEDGEVQIEAGALIKANNGVCCIDEINLMSKEHRGAIHEVMEAQKITFAKAGIRTELHTKCSIIAGMNQKNSNLPVDNKNFVMEGSLRSRFDLIFELVDPKDPELDWKIAQHILNGHMHRTIETVWPLERLQMHVLVAKEVRVEMSEAASLILSRYYQFCTRQEDIDVSRTTMRMLQSLERLTICHAKLMMRAKTKIIDAMTVLTLMESSWSFGYFMPQRNVLETLSPLGPTAEYIETVLQKLNLVGLVDDSEDTKPSPRKMESSRNTQRIQEITMDDIDRMFADDSDDEQFDDKTLTSQKVLTQLGTTDKNSSQFTQSSLQTVPKKQSVHDLPDDEMDFKPPLSTSTQIDLDELPPHKQKLQPIITDPIMSNLNSLAAIFAKANEQEKPSTRGSINKLAKFKYQDEATTSAASKSSVDYAPTSRYQTQSKESAETVEKIDDDGFDVWGDFEFN